MDKIEKFLRKLSPKEREVAEETIKLIFTGDTDRLDVKKLRGYTGVFRVRKGRLRIVYKQNDSELRLLTIDNRDDGTYRGF